MGKKYLKVTHNNYSPDHKEVVELSDEEIKLKRSYMKNSSWNEGENGELYDILEFGYKAAATYTPIPE